MKLLSAVLVIAIACLVPGLALATDSGALYGPGPGGPPPIFDRSDGFLTTLFASDNNYAGNSFDITPNVDVNVVGFDVNLTNLGFDFTVQVWTRQGTANGFETNPAGWSMLGEVAVTPAGTDLPTYVDIGGLQIAAGETVGVIITAVEAISGVGGFNYTNGGPTNFQNSDMVVRTYRGLAEGFPPTGTFEYRQWNGTVYYDYGQPVPVEDTTWGAIKVGYSK